MIDYNLVISTAFLIVTAYLSSSILWSKSRALPGPTSLPLVGNLFSLPTSHEWLCFASWAKQYGDDGTEGR